MKLTDLDVQEFIALWKKNTGEDLDAAQAREYAENAIGIVEVVVGSQWTQPPPKESGGIVSKF